MFFIFIIPTKDYFAEFFAIKVIYILRIPNVIFRPIIHNIFLVQNVSWHQSIIKPL